MMKIDDTFIIYTDRLKDGQVEKIYEKCSSDFLQLQNEEFTFDDIIEIQGRAYIAEKQLIVDINVLTNVKLPCVICNTSVEKNVRLKGIYLVKDLVEIRSGKYDFGQELRENILLEVPRFVECNNGSCPERKSNEKYIRKQSLEKTDYHPFGDLK